MEANNLSHKTTTQHDIEEVPNHYSPLSDHPTGGGAPATLRRRPASVLAVIIASVVFLISLVALISFNQGTQTQEPVETTTTTTTTTLDDHEAKRKPFFVEPRGIAQGVSAKSNPSLSDERLRFNWTNAMFSWQRTAFHFQPQKNWMNDPNVSFLLLRVSNLFFGSPTTFLVEYVRGGLEGDYGGIILHKVSRGPLFHKGWYHLFYQYNPDSAVWGNITWGHAVSTDLIHWLYLPIAMVPDHWYDINGVWTGSATILPNGKIVILYTGSTNESVQVQNLAYPADLDDPLLLELVKYPENPVLVPPPGIGLKDFRDPTTAWTGPDGKWRVTLGSKVNETGISLVYYTEDFVSYELSERYLHAVPGTGMWECVDFYPVSTSGSNGLETSANGPGVKHVLKASLDDTKVDHYAIGTYFVENDTWVPDNPDEDVGIGLRVDYGRYYASKTFYDQNKERRILWGWVNETDTEADDLEKGWSSLQTIPRTVLYDNKTRTNILQWPIEEIDSLRDKSADFDEVRLEPGSVVPLDIGQATQLDIIAEFEVESLKSEEIGNDISDCEGGAAYRSEFGPFGILVLADEKLKEFTPIYFRFSNSTGGNAETYFCADESRSSKANDVFKQVYGSRVPVLDGEKLSMRILVDHSIIESFAQGGRIVITSRIYPTQAIYGAARVFLFNNATGVSVKANLKIWQLKPAFLRPYPLD